MPARIVVVHDDAEFLDQVVAALRLAGYDVASFIDPLDALRRLEAAQTVEVLLPKIRFKPGKQHGISLAMMTRYKRPHVRILFVASPEFEAHAKDIGEFIPFPVDVSSLVARV